jgi:protein-L-isoaspartate O-methyltransferase
MPTVADLKRVHRGTWAGGNHAAVAEMIDEAPSQDLIAKADVRRGQEVLDVATGTGNLALRAAAADAQVVGLYLTYELFETTRRRAAEHGLHVDWVEGDGVQFTARHDTTTAELVRVCHPGGRIVVVNWAPGSAIGELLKTIAATRRRPRVRLAASSRGSEEHVRRLFAGRPRRPQVRASAGHREPSSLFIVRSLS